MSSTSARGGSAPRQPTPASEQALPSVTVIVPTYNRAYSLGDTLDCLIAQNYPPTMMEIIVVDNSSTDNTEQVIEAVRQRSPFPLHYFRKENRGPAVSRNYGLARAKGEIVAFTDSDCHMGPDWVRNAVRLMDPGVGLVAGPIEPYVEPERIPGFFSHQIDPVQRECALYPTANAFYRREVIEQLCGFNEQFGVFPWGALIGGEDTDLAWRVKRAGYRSAFADDAPVRHEAGNMSAKAWMLEPIRSQIFPLLVARIPELREDYLWKRYFINDLTPTFYLAVIGGGVTAATRFSPALALTLPWFWRHRWVVNRDVWPPARWWRIPIKLGLTATREALVVATLAYASIRYRAVVL